MENCKCLLSVSSQCLKLTELFYKVEVVVIFSSIVCILHILKFFNDFQEHICHSAKASKLTKPGTTVPIKYLYFLFIFCSGHSNKAIKPLSNPVCTPLPTGEICACLFTWCHSVPRGRWLWELFQKRTETSFF